MERGASAVAALVALVVLVTLSGVNDEVSARARSKTAGLCKANETPIFQCVLGRKQAAVCASGKVVQYRYGRPGKVELVYPGDPNAGPGTLKRSVTDWSGGGGQQIYFESDGYRYVLYSSIVRTGFGADGLHYPQDRNGLFITQGDRLVYDRHCSSTGSSIEIDDEKSVLPEGDYVWGPDQIYEH